MQPQSNLSGEHEGLQACLPHTYWSPSSTPTSIHNLGDDQNLLFTLALQVYTGASESTWPQANRLATICQETRQGLAHPSRKREEGLAHPSRKREGVCPMPCWR